MLAPLAVRRATARGIEEASEIAGNERPRPPRADASGLTAGITIVAGILLGTGLGLGLGWIVGAVALLGLAGGAAGVVLGFYVVYITFIRPRS